MALSREHTDIGMTNLHDESLYTTLRDGYNTGHSRGNNCDTSTPSAATRGVHKMTSKVESQISNDPDHFQVIFADHHVTVSVVCSKMVPNCALCQRIKADIETLNWRVDIRSLEMSPRTQTTHPACVGQADTGSGCASCLDIKADINKYIFTDMTGDVKVTALRDIGKQELSTVNERNNCVLEIKDEVKGVTPCKLESSEVLECLNKDESVSRVTSSILGAVGPREALEMPRKDNSRANVIYTPKFSGDKMFKCDVCCIGFCSKNKLTRHKKMHTRHSTREHIHRCDVCCKGFSTKSSLTRHNMVHFEEKPYRCDVCKKGFALKDCLDKHKMGHTGKKPYICGFCNKGFTRNSTFLAHLRMHTGERPYKCANCGTGFSTKSILVAHMRRHTGEKPYWCNICGKEFTSKFNLSRHNRMHTGEKPYTCQLCGKKFTQKHSLQKHSMIHKGDKQ